MTPMIATTGCSLGKIEAASLRRRLLRNFPHGLEAGNPIRKPVFRIAAPDRNMHAIRNILISETVGFEDYISIGPCSIDDDETIAGVRPKRPKIKARVSCQLVQSG